MLLWGCGGLSADDCSAMMVYAAMFFLLRCLSVTSYFLDLSVLNDFLELAVISNSLLRVTSPAGLMTMQFKNS